MRVDVFFANPASGKNQFDRYGFDRFGWQIDIPFDGISWQRNKFGFPVEREKFPTEAYADVDAEWRPAAFVAEMPDVFAIRGYWIVSERVAVVFRTFDMGSGALYPVKLFQSDRTSQVKGSFFCLHFGNRRWCLAAHDCKKLKAERHRTTGQWVGRLLSMYIADFDFAVTREALLPPDFWIDPAISSGFFVSGRLARELLTLPGGKNWNLAACRVVDNPTPGPV